MESFSLQMVKKRPAKADLIWLRLYNFCSG